MTSRRRAECVRCHRHMSIKARGLCQTCFTTVRLVGPDGFDGHPTLRRQTHRIPGGPPLDAALSALRDAGWLVCRCDSPAPDPIPAFDTVQCGRCGKKIAGASS